MRRHTAALVIASLASGVMLVACAGGGGAASLRPTTAGVPGAIGSAPAPLGGTAIRRTSAVGTCSSAGTGSFNGISANGNVAGGTDSTVAGGNSNEACDSYTAITGGNGNHIAGTSGGASDSFIGGGYQNEIYAIAAYSVIVGGYQNTVDPTNGNSTTVGGGAFNTASSAGAAVLGGESNTASGFVSALVGGDENTASGDYSFIGGGKSVANSGTYGTVGGGQNNNVSAEWATIAGGNTNTASGNGANVSGGANNTASGAHATVLGGSKNTASGNQSLAAGVDSNAATTGAFVWSDDSSGATQLTSTVDNQFLARASGGFTLWTNATNTVGATLASGSGTWASASDRAMKTNVARIDEADVLDKVATLPITTWSYVSERGVRHVGPMAQDFYAAFGVGADDRHITSIDEDGVALAAIKAFSADARCTPRTRRYARSFAHSFARSSARSTSSARSSEAWFARSAGSAYCDSAQADARVRRTSCAALERKP